MDCVSEPLSQMCRRIFISLEPVIQFLLHTNRGQKYRLNSDASTTLKRG